MHKTRKRNERMAKISIKLTVFTEDKDYILRNIPKNLKINY